MVLDNRTYEQLAGAWRDLFDLLKWDIIKSVLKSLGGFQRQKVKVRSEAGLLAFPRNFEAAREEL